MSNPEETTRPDAPEDGEEQTTTAPAAAGGGFVFRAVIVAAITFVVVITMAITLYTFVIPRPPTLDAAQTETKKPETEDEDRGPSVMVDLIEDGEFTGVLEPDGRRSVTCRYDICVKVKASGADLLKDFVDPKKKNMMPKITERVRQIIWAEDYTKLQVERLEDVKRRIMNTLNGMLGEDVVEEVIFKTWSIFQ